jgi:hypothetical protein
MPGYSFPDAAGHLKRGYHTVNFLEKTLKIKDINTGSRQVTVWTGEGTGLAYVQSLDTDGKLLKDTYNLMHASSGYALPYLVNSPEEAQTYLEKVANIFADKWNCKLRILKKRIDRNLLAQVELAHYDSLAPFVDYFLYAASGDDVYTESHIDAYDKDPNDAGNLKIAQQLLSNYPEATQVVMVRMAYADGIHHDLRTFEREAVVEQI